MCSGTGEAAHRASTSPSGGVNALRLFSCQCLRADRKSSYRSVVLGTWTAHVIPAAPLDSQSCGRRGRRRRRHHHRVAGVSLVREGAVLRSSSRKEGMMRRPADGAVSVFAASVQQGDTADRSRSACTCLPLPAMRTRTHEGRPAAATAPKEYAPFPERNNSRKRFPNTVARQGTEAASATAVVLTAARSLLADRDGPAGWWASDPPPRTGSTASAPLVLVHGAVRRREDILNRIREP
jgi:hypothetical protein